MTTIPRETLAKMTLQEKYDAIDTVDIRYARRNFLDNMIAECHDQVHRKCLPEGLIIYGPQGAGKTWAKDQYVKAHLKIEEMETEDGSILTRNILEVEILEGATKARVIEMMLAALGDPNPTAGYTGQKEHRLFEMIKDCCVELIILDEVHHLVKQKGNTLVIDSVADWLKSIMNMTGLPLILIGQPLAKELTQHLQLKDRFMAPFPMYGFRAKHIAEFKKILARIDHQLPFAELAKLDKGKIAKGLFEVSDGSFRQLMKVLRRAARLAVEREAEKLELEDLSKAWKYYREGRPDPFVVSKANESA